MKIIPKVLISLLFLIFTNAQPDSKNVEVIYEQALESGSKYTVLEGIEYSLVTNQIESTFELTESMDSDAYSSNERYIYLGGANGIHYRNKDIKLHQIRFKNKKIIIKDDSLPNNWKITTESKKIAGFLCYKAIFNHSKYVPELKKTVTVETSAWFTPEIAAPFGPIGFGGLPGLILQIRPYNAKFYFTAKSIKRNTDKKILKPTEGNIVSEEEFKELIKKDRGEN